MTIEEKVLYKVYFGVITAVTTIAAHKVAEAAWKLATGEEPPEPTDPDVPATQAFLWAMASGVGVGAAQVLTSRMVQRRWRKLGTKQKPSRTKVTV